MIPIQLSIPREHPDWQCQKSTSDTISINLWPESINIQAKINFQTEPSMINYGRLGWLRVTAKRHTVCQSYAKICAEVEHSLYFFFHPPPLPPVGHVLGERSETERITRVSTLSAARKRWTWLIIVKGAQGQSRVHYCIENSYCTVWPRKTDCWHAKKKSNKIEASIRLDLQGRLKHRWHFSRENLCSIAL